MDDILGNGKSDLEDLAFSNRTSRKSDEVRRRVCIEKAQASGFGKHATFAPASQKLLGFRLRSPHLFGAEPCPLSLQTVFPPIALRLSSEKDGKGMAFKIRRERGHFRVYHPFNRYFQTTTMRKTPVPRHIRLMKRFMTASPNPRR